jgi:hypothetical protein
MAMAMATDAVLELLAHFIQLRQSGANRDDAWYMTLDAADHLSDKQIQRLLHLAKNWEQREGNMYRGATNQHSTLVDDNNQMRAQIQQAVTSTETTRGQEHGNRSVEPFHMEEPPVPSDATHQMVTPDTTDLHINPTYFGDNTSLLLYFRGVKKPLQCAIPEGKEVLIGRMTSNSAMAPDIDLTPVKAANFGVSRLHAALQRRENTLLLTDLGALNHTYINGDRVHPHEVKALTDRDIIQLGRLEIGIRFYHQTP